MIRLTRRYQFSASHRLHTSRLTPEENAAVYGKCNHPHGHGHNYVLDVSVCGQVDPATGRLVSVPELDRLVESEALSRLRHRDLNSQVPEFAAVPPTTENLADFILDLLRKSWRRSFPSGVPRLERVRLQETPRNFFEAPNSEL